MVKVMSLYCLAKTLIAPRERAFRPLFVALSELKSRRASIISSTPIGVLACGHYLESASPPDCDSLSLSVSGAASGSGSGSGAEPDSESDGGAAGGGAARDGAA